MKTNEQRTGSYKTKKKEKSSLSVCVWPAFPGLFARLSKVSSYRRWFEAKKYQENLCWENPRKILDPFFMFIRKRGRIKKMCGRSLLAYQNVSMQQYFLSFTECKTSHSPQSYINICAIIIFHFPYCRSATEEEEEGKMYKTSLYRQKFTLSYHLTELVSDSWENASSKWFLMKTVVKLNWLDNAA